MAALPNLFERLDRIEKALPRFDASTIFNPLKEDEEAQSGSGAENREPETT